MSLFGSYVNTDAKNSDRYLVHLSQGGLGLPDESYYREDKFAEIRAAYVAHLARLLELVGLDDPQALAEQVMDARDRLGGGHWDRVENRDVEKTYNLMTLPELQANAPGFDWDAVARGAAGAGRRARRGRGPPARLRDRRGASCGRSARSTTGRRGWRSARPRRAPYLTDAFVEENFDFYGRTLTGTPELRERWKRGVGARRGRARRGGRQAVRRAALPAGGQGADGRAGRQPARGLPRSDLGRSTG